jgi:hypothetical protein
VERDEPIGIVDDVQIPRRVVKFLRQRQLDVERAFGALEQSVIGGTRLCCLVVAAVAPTLYDSR